MVDGLKRGGERFRKGRPWCGREEMPQQELKCYLWRLRQASLRLCLCRQPNKGKCFEGDSQGTDWWPLIRPDTQVAFWIAGESCNVYIKGNYAFADAFGCQNQTEWLKFKIEISQRARRKTGNHSMSHCSWGIFRLVARGSVNKMRFKWQPPLPLPPEKTTTKVRRVRWRTGLSDKFCFLQQHSLQRDVGVFQKMQEEVLYKLLCQGTNSKKKEENERMSLNQ